MVLAKFYGILFLKEEMPVKESVFISEFRTPLGPLTAATAKGTLIALTSHTNSIEEVVSKLQLPFAYELCAGSEEPLNLQVTAEVDAYFSGSLRIFTIPVSLYTTPFRASIYEALMKVPYGQTVSYKDLAAAIGSKAYRAVGSAMRFNPIILIVPCHRVLNSGGLGNYSGFSGPESKAALLALEQGQLVTW